MDKRETLKIMAVLKAAYPKYYAGISTDDAKQTVSLWQSMFEDYDYTVVAHAVKALIAVSKWPPSVSEVLDKIRLLTQTEEMTEQEAWGLVCKAVRNSAYHAEEEFQKLPKELQRVLGSHSVLREWALVDVEQLNTVVASNFMRSYRARIQSAREYLALPSEVREFAGKLAQAKSLDALEEAEPSHGLPAYGRVTMGDAPSPEREAP